MIDYFGSLENCQNDLHTWILVIVIVCVLIAVPIRIAIWRVLYYGMKEQIDHHRQREALAPEALPKGSLGAGQRLRSGFHGGGVLGFGHRSIPLGPF